MEIGIIRPAELTELMETAYLDYSMSVIVSRALPDVRDGLKPVQRRILYAMHNMGLRQNMPYRKSAGIVGEVLKEYHPHGDSAVYDAQVRLAQDFSMRYPLVDGQGNYGSVDGDPAAAMRYTEARLTAAAEEALADIQKDTVPFVPNYDEKTTEPSVLPARLPNLLLNGAAGIAVGMATNIPPHNLGELVSAITYLIDHPDAPVEVLMERLPGPDFPTGGIIIGREGIREAYATGKGRVQLRGKAHVEDGRGGRYSIVITELPFQVNKASLSERIAELIQEERIPGAHIVRDESDRTGMRLVVELKREADPRKVLASLYRLTPLQSTFGVNMLALVNGNEPRVLTLKRALQSYIDWRYEVITRRTEHDLREARDRIHILEGLKIALDNLNTVIKLIRESRSTEEAKRSLVARFKLSAAQVQAILDMRLARLAALERQRIEEEYKAVLKEIAYLQDLLANPKKIYKLIKADLSDLSSKYGDERRTTILDIAGDDHLATTTEQAPEAPALIAITNRGYIKSMAPDTYKRQRRNGTPGAGTTSREADAPRYMAGCSTLDHLLVLSDRGRAYMLRASDVPEADRTGKGVPLSNLTSIEAGERIASMVSMREFRPDEYLIMVSKAGRVKKTALAEYESARSSGVIAFTLDDGDELVAAGISGGKDSVIVATSDGQAIFFSEEDLRAMGRAAAGVAGVKLADGATVVGADIVPKGSRDSLLVITGRGMGKRVALSEFPQQGRAGGGVRAVPLTPKTGNVRVARVVAADDDLLVATNRGQLVRISAESVQTKARAAVSVPVITVDAKDEVLFIVRVPRAPLLSALPVARGGNSTGGNGRKNGANGTAATRTKTEALAGTKVLAKPKEVAPDKRAARKLPQAKIAENAGPKTAKDEKAKAGPAGQKGTPATPAQAAPAVRPTRTRKAEPGSTSPATVAKPVTKGRNAKAEAGTRLEARGTATKSEKAPTAPPPDAVKRGTAQKQADPPASKPAGGIQKASAGSEKAAVPKKPLAEGISVGAPNPSPRSASRAQGKPVEQAAEVKPVPVARRGAAKPASKDGRANASAASPAGDARAGEMPVAQTNARKRTGAAPPAEAPPTASPGKSPGRTRKNAAKAGSGRDEDGLEQGTLF